MEEPGVQIRQVDRCLDLHLPLPCVTGYRKFCISIFVFRGPCTIKVCSSYIYYFDLILVKEILVDRLDTTYSMGSSGSCRFGDLH